VCGDVAMHTLTDTQMKFVDDYAHNMVDFEASK
jgi:hypothetical protein